jgi:hypothetical protein
MFSKYLKYKTKYLNLIEQIGGGEFKNYNYNIERNSNEGINGYNYLIGLKGDSDNKNIRISVDYINDADIKKITIEAKLSSINKENIPLKISKMKDKIYFIIDDINGLKNDYCVWLSASKDYPDEIYLGYIRSQGYICYNPVSKIPQGDLLMNVIIDFSRYVGFKKIKLLDQSNKNCEYEPINFNQDRSLRSISILRTGDTYYGKYGFKPIDPTHLDTYNRISTILKRQIKEFKFNENMNLIKIKEEKIDEDKIKEEIIKKENIKDKKILEDKIKEEIIKISLRKEYIDALLDPNKQDKLFIDINNDFYKSNCYYEKIIRDLIEDDEINFINELQNSLSLSHFENMELIL